ncbi:MAG: NnrS family protein [Proteobacteria bacterium]|nr:NnrS family protein [Pseudomonadota bacterium]
MVNPVVGHGSRDCPARKAMRETAQVLFAVAFQPFFLLGAAWAALAVPLWTGFVLADIPLPVVLSPSLWHAHAMIFGFGGVILGGFLLTAVPNWTGLPEPRPWVLAGLVLAWLAGRATMFVGPEFGLGAVAAIDLLYPTALTAVVASYIVRKPQLRNLPPVLAVLLFTLANGMVHADRFWPSVETEAGFRAGLSVFVFLVSLIGGRVIPAFTRNWLKKQGATDRLPAEFDKLDAITLVTTLAALVAWNIAPVLALGPGFGASLVASLGAAASALNIIRLLRWAGWRTFSEPLVLILHLGFLWIPLGFAALALHALDRVPDMAAVHMFGAGLMGSMMLAMMTRATLGHSGGSLTADSATVALYGLVIGAGATRAYTALAEGGWEFGIIASTALWSAAFVLFLLRYGPLLLGRKVN